MTRVQNLFGRTPTSSADTKNFHGMPAWTLPLPERFIQVTLTNTLGNTFYLKQSDMLEQTKEVHAEMLKADPAFYAKGLVFARNKGYMRSQPAYGLACLARDSRPEARLAFAQAFGEVIRTPNDLNDFMTIHASLANGSIGGRRVKRVIGAWMTEKLSEYWTIKYGTERKAGSYTLRDTMQLVHPKTGEPRPLFDYIMGESEKRKVDISTLPQIQQFEALKKAKTDEEKIAAIKIGRLPHEVVTPFIGSSKKLWEALVPNLPIFALLKNLATLERQGVIESCKEEVLRKLTSPQIIQRSKILPFRFIEAEKHVTATWVKDALRDAVELAFDNVPEIPGKTAVLLDVSPSMQPGMGWFHHTPSPADAARALIGPASVLSVAVAKKAKCDVVAFDGSAKRISISQRDSLLTQAQKFWGVHVHPRGGTNQSAALDILRVDNEKVDNVVLLTDGEQNMGRPFAQALQEYRVALSRKAKVFVIDVSPHGHALMAPDDKNVYCVSGWSDQILNFIALASQGWTSLADHVKSLDLETAPKP